MKTLQTRVNLVPLISKADMLTPKEIKKFKKKILEEIAKNQIRIYQVRRRVTGKNRHFKIGKMYEPSIPTRHRNKGSSDRIEPSY